MRNLFTTATQGVRKCQQCGAAFRVSFLNGEVFQILSGQHRWVPWSTSCEPSPILPMAQVIR
jgi:hypothetical protein